MEQWKMIKCYDDYMISNHGRVKTLNKKKGFFTIEEMIMKLKPNKRGYVCVFLVNNNKKKKYSVHRLVAEAFINNPNNLSTVNHINENKSDNRAENLEWMSFKDNIRYTCLGEMSNRSKSVKQYNLEMKLVKTWKSVRDIERKLNINHGCINYYCKKNKPYKGYYWTW